MLKDLTSFIARYPGRKIVVGYSGGRDSHVLLHALSRLVPCVAFHINHQLHPNALAWQAHCEREALRLGCQFETRSVVLQVHDSSSIEAMAREARYKALGDFLEEGSVLVTAHHSADQTESVLLALLRGSSPEGLKGIEPDVPFRKGRLVRPLLAISPVELADYAAEHQLQWITDTSNYDSRYTRNAIRLQCLPRLLAIEPALLECVGRTASYCLESSDLLNQLILERHKHRFQGKTLCLKSLETYMVSEQKALLRLYTKQVSGSYPPHSRLYELLRQLQSPSDKMPEIPVVGGVLRRYRQRLYYLEAVESSITGVCLAPEQVLPAGYHVRWDVKAPLELPNGVILDHAVFLALGFEGPFEVMARAGDLPCHIGRRKTSLKNLYQSLDIPPWERDKHPLLLKNGIVVAIPGICVEACVATIGNACHS